MTITVELTKVQHAALAAIAERLRVTLTRRLYRVADNGSAPDERVDVRKLVDALPDRATGDDLAYQIYLLASIAAGLADVEAGRTVSHDEAVARIRSRIRRAP